MSPIQYLEFANRAAQLERDGQWLNAAFAWTGAAHHARNLKNRHWATARCDFCHGRIHATKGAA
ncbi:MAG: ANR family transcriptional regulator [Vibrio sp.]